MAQSYEISSVQSLTRQIEEWCSNGGAGGRSNISKFCMKGMRISDDLTMRMAERNGAVLLPTYELNDYLNFMKDEMQKTYGFSIVYTNIKKLSKNKLPNNTRGYDFYICEVSTSGALTYSCKDLFLVKKGKVHGIAPYMESKRNKVHIDWDDFIDVFIDDEESYGVICNYSKHFPIGASAFYSFPDIPMMIGLDFGLATGKDKYVIDKVEMTDIMNYERTKKTLDPKFFVTVTPHVYFSYFAIGCGVGALYMSGMEDYKHCSSHSSSFNAGDIPLTLQSSATSSMSMPGQKCNFMLRPALKGFIPLFDEWALALSVAYDYVFGYKEKNGLSFGLGIKYNNW